MFGTRGSQVQILPLRPSIWTLPSPYPTDTATDIAGRDMCMLKHNLAKVGIVGSNPIARCRFSIFVRGSYTARNCRIRQLLTERSTKAPAQYGENPGSLFAKRSDPRLPLREGLLFGQHGHARPAEGPESKRDGQASLGRSKERAPDHPSRSAGDVQDMGRRQRVLARPP
jgi:hypothetical protein